MKHTCLITASALATLLLWACINDKGNYEYHDVNSITISGINNVNESYLVPSGEYLNITPTLKFSVSEEQDSYRYEWHQMGSAVPYQSVRLLSTERNLSLKIDGSMSNAGRYYLMYCVTNLATGVRYDHVFMVTVQNRRSQGYIVLHEQSGGSFDLDLVARYGDSLTRYRNILNIFESGLPRAGRKPLDVLCYTDFSAPSPYYVGEKQSYSVWVLTDKSTDRVKAEDYSYAPDYNISKLSLIPAAFLGGKPLVAEKMVSTTGGDNAASTRCYMYFNGSWFFFTWSPIVYFFNQPLNVLYGDPLAQPYAASPHIIVVATYGAIMFDEANHRFMVHKTNSADMYTSSKIYCSHRIVDEDLYFKWENPGYRLMHMSNRTWQNGFAVVKDTITGSFDLLQMRLVSNGVAEQLARSTFQPTFDAGAIKFFAYHPTLPYLYCATEDKVYRVLVSTMTATDVTDQLIPPGHKVSVMEFLFVRSPWGSRLTLATYDPSGAEGQNGTLSFYAVNDGTGSLTLAKHPAERTSEGYQIDMSWTGFGKIVAVDYKQH
jgi:hypothetical protein